MHPLSPHAPTRRNKTRVAVDPLEALETEIHGKLAPGSSAAKAHPAAAELMLRRPRRPGAQPAGMRMSAAVR